MRKLTKIRDLTDEDRLLLSGFLSPAEESVRQALGNKTWSVWRNATQVVCVDNPDDDDNWFSLGWEEQVALGVMLNSTALDAAADIIEVRGLHKGSNFEKLPPGDYSSRNLSLKCDTGACCMFGALSLLFKGNDSRVGELAEIVKDVLFEIHGSRQMSGFNDAFERTKAEVAAMFRLVAQKEREAGR